ncbi:MAG TPA: hypothetical protein VFN10_09445 [Thermoanaerobaculia bacterium]|nr:hypothetical protein [Thermoanaerobaculia bacterium]
MGCDHKGGPELIEMAEAHLRAAGTGESEWPGRKFRWSENLDAGMWASVIVEVERRGDQWIVTRLDRRKEPVEETGFAAL